MARSKKASTALLVAVSTLALFGGVFVKAAEEGSCYPGSGGDSGSCQAPAATDRASEGGGLFGGFSFESLTGLFGGGESSNLISCHLISSRLISHRLFFLDTYEEYIYVEVSRLI